MTFDGMDDFELTIIAVVLVVLLLIG